LLDQAADKTGINGIFAKRFNDDLFASQAVITKTIDISLFVISEIAYPEIYPSST
jgi:hypothetical protein